MVLGVPLLDDLSDSKFLWACRGLRGLRRWHHRACQGPRASHSDLTHSGPHGNSKTCNSKRWKLPSQPCAESISTLNEWCQVSCQKWKLKVEWIYYDCGTSSVWHMAKYIQVSLILVFSYLFSSSFGWIPQHRRSWRHSAIPINFVPNLLRQCPHIWLYTGTLILWMVLSLGDWVPLVPQSLGRSWPPWQPRENGSQSIATHRAGTSWFSNICYRIV